MISRVTYRLLLFLLLFQCKAVQSQTINGTTGSIPDNNTWKDFIATVAFSSNPPIDTISYGLQKVCLTIKHTYVGDLKVILIAPDGTEVTLADRIGGGGANFTNCCFNNAYTNAIILSNPPYTGNQKPMGFLGRVNNGQSVNGVWKLRIRDTAPGDTGIVQAWSISFGASPVKYVPFTSSNLPIVFINTPEKLIVDEPRTLCRFRISYAGAGVRNSVTPTAWHYNGFATAEFRGSSSQGFPKKSYGITTCDSLQNDSNVSLVGMPAEHDWILTSNYADKTLMRNALVYDWVRKTGKYATRNRLVELVVDGEYQGVYLLCEKIKRDANRVDLSKLKPSDTTGTQLSGGYILKIDKATGSAAVSGWTSSVLPYHSSAGQQINFLYDYPAATDIHPLQSKYIKTFVDSFERTLASSHWLDPIWGYRRFVDINYFIDYLLFTEFVRNTDGYRISAYIHKNKDTQPVNRLRAGPLWDYDLALGNANYCNGDQTSGWAYQFNLVCGTDGYQVPFWWERMMSDTLFQNQLRCRWEFLRNDMLSQAKVITTIDSVASILNEAQQRNFSLWPILGKYVWPNPAPYPSTYPGVNQQLKNFLAARANWLDQNIPGNCLYSTVTELPKSALVWPNPAKEWVRIPGDMRDPILFTLDGRMLKTNYLDEILDLNGLPAGVYILRSQNYAPLRLVVQP